MSSCAGVTSNGLELAPTAVAVSSVSDRVCSSDFVSLQGKLSNGICSPRKTGVLPGLGSYTRYCQWNTLGKAEPVSSGKISASAQQQQLQREPLLLLVKHLHMQIEELLQLHAGFK